MAKKKGDEEQQYLPGTAPEKNPRVHKAATAYLRAMAERQALLKDEVEAKGNLELVMTEEGLEHYEYGNIRVDINKSQKVTAKIVTEKSTKEEKEEE